MGLEGHVWLMGWEPLIFIWTNTWSHLWFKKKKKKLINHIFLLNLHDSCNKKKKKLNVWISTYDQSIVFIPTVNFKIVKYAIEHVDFER